MQVADFSKSLSIWGSRHHFSGLSECSLTLPRPRQTMENPELALDSVFCFPVQLAGDTCYGDKQRCLVSKAVNLKGNPLAKKIGNSVSAA